MPGFETIQKWIVEKTIYSPDYRNNKIEIGGLDFSLLLKRDKSGLNNPLEITLQSNKAEPIRVLFSIFSKGGQTPDLGFIKKISYTPFYHSYLISPSSVIDIVDFYNWGKYPELYRLFLVDHQEPDCKIQISFPDINIPRPVNNKTFQTGSFFWSGQEDTQIEGGIDGLILKPLYFSNQSAVLAVTISLTDIPSSVNSKDHSFKLLASLSDQAVKNHIKNNFYVNNRAAENKLDDLWTWQKAITPDWKVTEAILSDPVHYQFILTWIVEIAIYFNHQDLLKEIFRTLNQNLDLLKNYSRLLLLHSRLERLLTENSVKQYIPSTVEKSSAPVSAFDSADPFRACLDNDRHSVSNKVELNENQLLYRSYFSTGNDDDFTCDLLQQYWDRLSLPLFENKLESELESNPEKIIILYLLGLYYDLPYAEILAGKIDLKVDNAVLLLFIFLQGQIQKRCHLNSVYSFKDGSRQDYTGKKLNLFDQSSLRFTRYGQICYVQFISADNFRFRIDKRIHCFVDTAHRKISVYPDVPFYPQNVCSDRRMEVQIANYIVSWPFLWPKAEVFIAGIRFRWIFKKRRYQITIQKKKGSPDLTIDGQSVDWSDNQKTIRYFEVKNTNPEIKLRILDVQGRNIHLRQKALDRKIHVIGWTKNRHNQFEDFFTYKYGNRQHCIDGSGQNGIRTLINIPSATNVLTVGIKGLKQVIELICCSDQFWEKLYRYSLKTGSGCLVVLIDAAIKEQFRYIQTFFSEYFAFQPKYIFSNQKALPITCSIMIYISSTEEGITIRNDKRLTAAPYLVVGVKQGIEQLKSLRCFIEQNLIQTKTGPIKRSDKA